MPYIDPERIKKAKEMDLVTFKQLYEPYDLEPTGRNTYRLKSQHSLKLSNGLWEWWGHDIGGKSALKYLEKVRGMGWMEAVLLIESLQGAPDYSMRIEENKVQRSAEKNVILPEKNRSNDRVERYLAGRGISMNVIKYCMEKGLIYEDKTYHNAVFVGYDGDKPAYAFCRGTGDKKVMIEARGSRKEHSFRLMAEPESRQVHVFEAAIDALSYASVLEMYGVDFRSKNLLSLGGIAAGRSGADGGMKPPPALSDYLIKNPDTEAIVLHLDNDEPGRAAALKIIQMYGSVIAVKDSPPPEGKDCNDYLKIAEENLRKNAPLQSQKSSVPAGKNGAPGEKNASVSGKNFSGGTKKSSVRNAENLRGAV